jgi:cytosine deaminase
MTLDYLIKNAKTRFSGNELVQIGIKDGQIAAIAPKVEGDAKQVVDADGHLVTESFVNGHLHLCKVYTLSMMDDEALGAYTGEAMGGAMTAIELAARVKEKYDESWIIENVRKAVKLAIRFGNTHIRAFADTDTKARLEGVKALIRAREEFKGKVDLQVVAFPQDGVVRDPGAEDYVEEALKLGADVVGGIPWIEYTDADAQEHIDRMFALAKKYNKPISMLIDDAGDPTLRTLEMLAVKTIKEGWEGRVTAQHARAMALYPEPYYRKIEYLLKRALEPYLPHDLMYRRKMGFAVPLEHWFRGPLRDKLRASVLSERMADTGYFDMAYLGRMVEDHIAGYRDHSAALWSLLMFAAFLENQERHTRTSIP